MTPHPNAFVDLATRTTQALRYTPRNYWTGRYSPKVIMQPRTDPSGADRQQRMRDAARELWLEHGYDTSMDAVARRAGCSKQTVYAHFGSKQGLFREVVADLVSPLIAHLGGDSNDLREALLAFAIAHSAQLASPAVVVHRRRLIAEAPRFPAEAEALWHGGLAAIHARLAQAVSQAMARGELRSDDPDAAAEVFLGLANGIETERLFFGRSARDEPAARLRWCEQSVDFFLHLYAPLDIRQAPRISP